MELNCFCKDIGVLVNFIVCAHEYKIYIKVKILCDQVGTALKILEKVSPRKNRSELYIGLLKEAVIKDMHALH